MRLRDRFASLFGNAPTSAKVQPSIEVTARLNHLLMPIDRGDRYEDPLHEVLSAGGVGSVDGGGTMQLESGEIEYIEVEVSLTDAARGVPLLTETLETLGAPKGSMLLIPHATGVREMPLGKVEGVGVYLDGVNLPDEVYRTSDVNVVIAELGQRLQGAGEMHSHWEGNQETGLYFYGPDAEEMKRRMKDFLSSYPLCKGARVVTIAPRAG